MLAVPKLLTWQKELALFLCFFVCSCLFLSLFTLFVLCLVWSGLVGFGLVCFVCSLFAVLVCLFVSVCGVFDELEDVTL